MVVGKSAGPRRRRVLNLETNRFAALDELEEHERQFYGLILMPGRARKGLSQLRVIKSRLSRILFGIYQNEFKSFGADLPVPEPVGLLDPVRGHLGNERETPHVAGKKTLRALVVFQCALRKRRGEREEDHARYYRQPIAESHLVHI